MLEVNHGSILRLIDLAREFHADQSVQISDDPPVLGDEWQAENLEAHAENPVLAEFRSAVEELNPDEQQQVVVLLWIGRGDYEVDEWSEALDYAADAWTPETADYLIAHPMLADHLEAGLEAVSNELD
ncbi:MAG: DUF3775 domain-containing protein [Wenzhouxiangellaceae bacterium]|nr:DUF3775 domain-containing protein [Wenzhouxiangellaceae bacterium]